MIPAILFLQTLQCLAWALPQKSCAIFEKIKSNIFLYEAHRFQSVRVGAHMGPYGPDFVLKILILMKNHKIVNKNIKGVKSEKIKVKTWFCDKDLSSLDSIN